MSDPKQTSGDGGSASGGRKRKRYTRNRRRSRKPQAETPDARSPEPGGKDHSKSRGKSAARGARKSGDGGLDPARRARRDRRRRKRTGDQPQPATPPEPAMELDIEPKQVFVYTHVLRPSLREVYEYRAEHFSQTGRTLADFHIDLSSILIYPGGDETAEPVIDLHIGGAPGEFDGAGESDWDDDEPLSDDLAPPPQHAP
jgi:hypothetical protein